MSTAREKKKMIVKMERMNAKSSLNQEVKDNAVQLLNNAIEIGNKVYCYIPTDLLKIDQEMYQRPLGHSVKSLIDNWDDDRCDAITVNYREDGFFYVINGQHRTEAARIVGCKLLVCDVFVGLSLKEESSMFVCQYDNTSKLKPIDSYRANIIRGDIVDLEIKKCCDKYGIEVTRGNAPKTLKGLTIARRIVQPVSIPSGGKCENAEKNAEILDWVLSILKVWEDYKGAYDSDLMQSLWFVWRNNQNKLNSAKDNLITFFETSSPKEIKSLGNVEYPDCGHGGGIYRIMMDIVNGEI